MPNEYFGLCMTLSGALGLWFSIAVLRNPAFYSRKLRYGSPQETPIQPFAIMGVAISCIQLLFGAALLCHVHGL